jgi:hypothetical protein
MSAREADYSGSPLTCGFPFVDNYPGRAGHQDEQAADQGLRLDSLTRTAAGRPWIPGTS